MAWFALIIGGLFEMLGVLMINKWHKDRSFLSFVYLVLSFSASFLGLAYAMRTLPMGTSYAIWTGIGVCGGAVLGMFFYNEPKELKRIGFISLILIATIGLKLIS